jgi:hypothetical protein
VPEQPAPLQPLNVEPAAGVAVSVTIVPSLKDAEQVAPQLIPAGALVTEPDPVPAFVTVSTCVALKVAVTDWSALIVTTHVPVPEQPAPLQPVKADPAAGVAVKVTTVPSLKDAEQVAPQLIPAGAPVTEPEPDPVFVTVSVCVGTVLNVAVTDRDALIVTMQVPVPEQPSPLQPANAEPSAAVAVSVTTVPSENGAEHVAPQLMPAGELVTVPEPEPAFVTVRVKVTAGVTVIFAVGPVGVTELPVAEAPALLK